MSAPSPSTPSSLFASVVAELRAAGCVFAEDEAQLILATARTHAEVTAMTGRRAAGLPLEHVLGWAAFAGLRVTVDPGVFVPRRRSEFLVGQAVALARPPLTTPLVVADLCCGTGAIGAAVTARLTGALPGPHDPRTGPVPVELHAADVDPAAVRCARRTIAPFGGQAHQGDLYAALPSRLRGRIGLLVASAPYVPTGDIRLLPAEARDHEPRISLDGGADGLDVVRRVAAGAPGWLAPGAHLLLETSPLQAEALARDLTGAGLPARAVTDPGLDAATVIATVTATGTATGTGTAPHEPPRRR
ncbi:putative protein N(5)-glutamine methyltransferase [Sphaerisporangium rubeum]|uniref:Release factor glutamine methyltransferase n=1 Tax=Sphaerisporangium rubeum TaxID=321317 RepID=A0A7X0IF18_9ACTN|nr:putative protein N(5)-glutamine methyltransferase [Sphaerisporangium rubeum]MBB6473956.1 release factor glutamine methyltransferase [Sphaerisporangium rubeum]